MRGMRRFRSGFGGAAWTVEASVARVAAVRPDDLSAGEGRDSGHRDACFLVQTGISERQAVSDQRTDLGGTDDPPAGFEVVSDGQNGPEALTPGMQSTRKMFLQL